MSQAATEKSAGTALPSSDPSPSHMNGSCQGSVTDSKLPLLLIGILCAITAGHYSIPGEYNIAHNILQRLYYVPIVLAAFHYGRKGGLVVSIVSGTLYLVNQVIEIMLFPLVGLAAGHLFEQKALSLQQLQSFEKMALFGKLSRTIIRSLKGPLRAIKGMLMAIEPIERRETALESCVEIIRNEVTKIETLRDDLISLVERRKLRLKKQNLNDLMFEFVSQVEMGLGIKGVRVKKQVQDIKLLAQCNRKALLNALHHLLGCIIDQDRQIRKVTFYSGQSSTYLWLGATADQIHLPTHYRGKMTSLDTHDFHEYELISIMNVMHNHFGDVKFRWQDHRMVEFILAFPKRLKLPWYLRDEPLIDNKQNTVKHRM
jgi:uncharacterized membrane protein